MALLTKASLFGEPNEREKCNLKVAYEAACESIVLLENDGTLPIQIGRVALYGIEGRLITEDDLTESETDTCIYVLSRQAGEGVDRKAKPGDMFVSEAEETMIAFCAKHYQKFILVINAGTQVDMSFLDKIEGINAVLFICQLGTAGGTAVADVLSGKVTPSGKLASTWAKKYADIPYAYEFSYLNGNLEDEYYKEGIYVGYRYFDTFGVEPRYPFGYGKSYTEFEIATQEVKLDGTIVSVRANVKNIGECYSGKEVVEVYISAPSGTLDKEYQSLVGFAKTKELAPGEEQTVEVTFDMCEVSSYREADASYILEAGDYIIRIGNSSRATTACAIIVVKEEIIVSKHENVCKVHKPFEELKAPTETVSANTLKALRRLELDADAVETCYYAYDAPMTCAYTEVDRFVDELTLEDMAEIVVGIGMFGGKTRFTMPGSVGNTTAFPVSAALAQTFNTDMLYKVGLAIHEEMKEYGCTYWLAPALNIHRNPLCGRNFEYYSEDPFLTGKMASAVTKGVQSEEGYYVTIKHYACNNQEENRKAVSSNVSERALREIYLRGFERAVREAKAKGVMTSYNKVNGVYTSNSYDLCMKVLRFEWGFDGVVMTDWFSTGKKCGNTALCMAVGNDLIMPGGKSYKKEIVEGVKRGIIKEDDVRNCCKRVVKAIFGSALQKEYMK